MKVGILTFHSSYNFGANLQTLSVQEMLRARGCSPFVIDYRDPWKTEMYHSRVSSAQVQVHEQFIEKYLTTSRRFSRPEEVQEYCEDALDLVLVGSDQVFRLLPKWAPKQLLRLLRTGSASSAWTQVTDQLPIYWLPWPKRADGMPARASIAASGCGTAFYYLGRSLRRETQRCLRNFDFVSVRDEWTRLMVRWLSSGEVKPEVCPDPVFGLNSCFQIPPEEPLPIDVSNTILISATLGKSWLARFRDLAHKRGLTISNLPDPHATYASDECDFTIHLPLSPLAWYDLLARVVGYVGIRYHGLVSSAANRTPAISLDVSNRPRCLKLRSRSYDLCRKAGAQARYVPVNWLAHPSPEAVMGRLTDESSQARMDSYAEQARLRLTRIFDEIMTCVNPPVRA